ncbi:MAG: YbaB/EbfC family nucleoid-associated protein [Candidatus Moranbacteria bacterium]|nr:YbaB/EbfC family nucleoid-associated protein [Candidatus Moranbacteria bacterium]
MGARATLILGINFSSTFNISCPQVNLMATYLYNASNLIINLKIMLGQLKELKRLRRIKKQMEEITVTEEYEGVKVTMNGAMEVTKVEIADQTYPKLPKYVRKAVNRAVRSVQKKMMENAGGLSSLLGG